MGTSKYAQVRCPAGAKNSPAGNRTRVTRVTGGYTYLYTTRERYCSTNLLLLSALIGRFATRASSQPAPSFCDVSTNLPVSRRDLVHGRCGQVVHVSAEGMGSAASARARTIESGQSCPCRWPFFEPSQQHKGCPGKNYPTTTATHNSPYHAMFKYAHTVVHSSNI
jgi:hypothetical protein